MPNTDQLYVKYKSTQCGSFSIGKASWIEDGGKQPLPVKKLKNIEMSNTSKSMLEHSLEEMEKEMSLYIGR